MNIYLQYITIGVSLGTALGVAAAFFWKNKNSSSGEALSLLQKENEIFRDQLHKKEEAHLREVKEIREEFTKQVSDLTEKFGIMQGKYEKEKEEREKFEAIAKDKNPETQEFMKFMIDTQKEVVNILKEIHTYAKVEHDRDFNITATVTKT